MVCANDTGVDGSGVARSVVFDVVSDGTPEVTLTRAVLADSDAQEIDSGSVSFTTHVISSAPKGVVPEVSNLEPKGVLAENTTEVMLYATTNIQAFCGYSQSSSAWSSLMPFAHSDSTAHNTTLSDLDPGNYSVRVRCRDAQSSATSSVQYVNFSIPEPEEGNGKEEENGEEENGSSTPSTPSTSPSSGSGGGGIPPQTSPSSDEEEGESSTRRVEHTSSHSYGTSRTSAEFDAGADEDASVRTDDIPSPRSEELGEDIVVFGAHAIVVEGTTASPSSLTVSVNVSEEWLVAQGVRQEDIVVFGYSNEVWNEVPASVTSENGQVTVTSFITGVERYTIGARQPAPEPAPEETGGSVQSDFHVQKASSRGGLRTAATILLLFGVVLGAVGGVVLVKNRRPPQLNLKP